jgi:hypothetical protein
MAETWRQSGGFAVLGLLGAGGLFLAGEPERAPALVLLGLATTAWPLVRAWRGARGTALRPAIVWGGLAVTLGLVSQAVACAEPLASGRPWAGHLCYVSVLATLAALISVLNARTPGGGAWAILMALLVLVFLIPWLEGPGQARGARGIERLRLAAPWTIFYGLIVVAGVTNFVPTRYGPASLCLAAGLVVEYLSLTRGDWAPPRKGLVWSVVPWTLAVAIWVADRRSGWLKPSPVRLDSAWFWFRDHWGVVWGLRVLERFNRSSEAQGWPVRLGWFGVSPTPGSGGAVPPSVPESAEVTFRTLLRRFAEPWRVDEAEGGSASGPCQGPDTG